MKKQTTARPITCDYGTTKGHCSAPRKAVLSVMRYLEKHGRRHAVIEAPGGVVVDVWWNSHWGPIVQVRGQSKKVAPTKLRVVK